MRVKLFLRKIVALGLMISMMSALCLTAHAELPEDVVGTPYEKAIGILMSFDIVQNYTDGTFRPEESITRAELTALAIRAMNFDLTSMDSGSSFMDVSDEHWAADVIGFAADLGIIQGNGDGTFAPDEQVTYNEAIKIFVNMLDGGVVAGDKGGYPSGYLTVASQRKITQGLSFEPSQSAKRGVIIQMLFNTMKAETYKKTGYGSDKYSYQLDSSDTLFSRMNAVKQQYGVVTANYYTRIDGENGSARNNEVIINVNGNELVFDAGETNAEELLGYEVEFYAISTFKDSSDMTLMYIAPRNNRNDVIEVSADDVTEFTVNDNIKYVSENGRQKTQKIAPDATYIYNGVYVTAEMLAGFDISNFYSGSIKLLKRAEGNGYDTIFITDYKHRIVTSLNTDESIIRINLKQESGKDAIEPPEIDLNDEDLKDRIYLDGNLLSNDELKELSITGGAAASIAESMDGEVRTIYLSTETIDGKINVIKDDGRFTQITVDGETYKVSPDMSDALDMSKDYWGFVLSFDGFVVGLLENEDGLTILNTTRQYGYLIKAKKVNKGIDDVGMFQILQTDSKIASYAAAQKIKYNEETRQGDIVASQIVPGQLIIFKLNAKQEISEIETAEDKQMDTKYIGYTKDKFTLDAKGDMYYQTSNPPTLNGEFRLDKNTIVFYIPQDKKDENGEIIKKADLEEYGAGDYTLFQKEKTYVVEIYDNDKFKVPSVVINRGFKIATDDIVPFGSSCFLIEEIVNVIDDDGTLGYQINGLEDGKKVSRFLEKDKAVYEKDKDASNGGISLSSLAPGTVVQLLYNINGEISLYRLLNVYEESPMKETVVNGSGYNVGLLISYGYANDVRKDVMTVTTDAGGTIKSYSIANANFYLYDTVTEEARIATYEDIRPFSSYGDDASKVFLRVNSQDVKDVIIYR